MSVREVVLSHLQQVAGERGKQMLPPLTDDLVFTHSGLDSLEIAILVTRLEDVLGVDPFTQFSKVTYPVTLGDFIQLYEDAAGPSNVA